MKQLISKTPSLSAMEKLGVLRLASEFAKDKGAFCNIIPPCYCQVALPAIVPHHALKQLLSRLQWAKT